MLTSALFSMFALASSATRPVLQAEITLDAAQPDYRLELGETLTAALGQDHLQYLDVIDAQGRAMPRGEMPWTPPGKREGEAAPVELPLAFAAPVTRRLQPPQCETAPPDLCTELERHPEVGLDLGEQRLYGAGPNARSGGVVVGMAADLAIVPAPPNGGPSSVRAFTNDANASLPAGAAGRSPGGAPPGSQHGEHIVLPLTFHVSVAEPVPADFLRWRDPRLVLTWRSALPPESIQWQIGRRVGELTQGEMADAERLNLGDLHKWGVHAVRAWRRPNRFFHFGTLPAVRSAEGIWQASLPLSDAAAYAPLEIGTASAAVQLLSMRLQGRLDNALLEPGPHHRTIELTAAGDRVWRIGSDWPARATSLSISISPQEHLALHDAGMESVEFVLQSGNLADLQRPDGAAQQLNLGRDSLRSEEVTVRHWTWLRQTQATAVTLAPVLQVSYASTTVWFENRGTAPYRVRVGEKSDRPWDESAPPIMQLVDVATGLTLASRTPFAKLGAVRQAGTYTGPSADETPDVLKRRANDRMALWVLATAALLVAMLAALAFRLSSKTAREPPPSS
ncbi:MAG: hypothetical protein ABI411_17980 [Tahibacter sp.]